MGSEIMDSLIYLDRSLTLLLNETKVINSKKRDRNGKKIFVAVYTFRVEGREEDKKQKTILGNCKHSMKMA